MDQEPQPFVLPDHESTKAPPQKKAKTTKKSATSSAAASTASTPTTQKKQTPQRRLQRLQRLPQRQRRARTGTWTRIPQSSDSGFPCLRPTASDNSYLPQHAASPYLPANGDRPILNSSHSAVEPPRQFILPLLRAEQLIKGTLDRTKYVLNFGGSVWGLDWAKVEDPRYQYLAIGGYPTTVEKSQLLGTKQVQQGPDDHSLKGCVQIWRIDTTGEQVPVLDLCFLTECGVVFGLEWSDAAYFEDLNVFKRAGRVPQGHLARLGLLAVSFGDGTCRVLNQEIGAPLDHPLFVKCDNYLFTAVLPDTLLWKPSWGGPNTLATACANGNVAIWDINNILEQRLRLPPHHQLEPSADPATCFPAHNTAIFTIQFEDKRAMPQQQENSAPIGTILYTCGYDGQTLMIDIRDPYNPILLYKIRGIVNALTPAPHMNGFCVGDTDNSVRYFRPTDDGDGEFKSIGVAAHMSCIWDLDLSPHLPFLGSVGADGCAKISNMNRTQSKSYKPVQNNLYQIGFDAMSGVYSIVEDTPEEPLTDVLKKSDSTMIFAPEIALQKIVFNKNSKCLDWVASGGTSGLVRVESCFKK
ncbi:WD40 repeat-like protein [Rhizoclosmatium globosum]|uniref:WD40 repeat-like protein n=1 Tax=Rhizoclosmatium globosum TaxID=329046 RepID=A0A1Y2C208_9FUNG|nr:WD40 repeat-like protein [Rhizoclosmatium globosum]|eukprot:ORY41072.1 WD40 repeat-like protein [Rhizoclosmatium globosum]